MLWWQQPLIATASLLAIGILLNWNTRWQLLRVYLVFALAGSLSEILAIWSGAWSYGLPQLFGIPIWLPLVWGNSSLLLAELIHRYGQDLPDEEA